MLRRLTALFASRGFWVIILVFFLCEALWISLSAIYPMAFDEDFHFGVIALYAGVHTPFLSHLPLGAQAYGAINRDPSYLYHYLMSFPYMLFRLFTSNITAQVIFLRFINIALFFASLMLWRKVLLKGGVGKAAAHIVLTVVVLLPITPLLAGQINYDNLLILMVAWVCLLTQSIISVFKQNRVPAALLICTLSACLVINLIKYAFLPITLATIIFIAGYAAYHFRHRFVQLLITSWRAQTVVKRLVLCALLIFSFGLFFERYGVNIILYRTPIPDCSKVLDNEACLQYGPWNRDYYLALNKSANIDTNPFTYTQLWGYGMWYRLFFTINGEIGNNESYQNYPPLPVIGIGAIVLVVSSFIVIAWQARSLFRNRPMLVYFALMIIFYCLILWYQNYQMFIHTGQAVAVNGRYLLMIIIPFGALCASAFSQSLKDLSVYKPILVCMILVVFLQGGGVISFIVRSDSHWYLPNPIVKSANQTAQTVLRPLVIGSTSRLDIPSP